MSLSDRCAPYMIGRKGGMHMHEAANGVMNKLGLLEAQRDFYRKIKWTCQCSQQWKRGWDGGGIYCFCRWIRSRRQSEYVYPDLHKRTVRLNKCLFVREERKGGEEREKNGWKWIVKTVTLLCRSFFFFPPLLLLVVWYSSVSEKLLSALRLTGPLSPFIWSELEREREKQKQMSGVWKSNMSLALSVMNKGENKRVEDERVFFFLCIHIFIKKTFYYYNELSVTPKTAGKSLSTLLAFYMWQYTSILSLFYHDQKIHFLNI